VLIIEPKIFGDARGFFVETFQSARYIEAGIPGPFVQDNLSRSTYGVLRGLHLQNPGAQGKLVTVFHGRVLDVAVDLRRGSPNFGRHVSVELSAEDHLQFWVPRGFGHGYVVLSETADFFYKCDNFYSLADELVVRWDDPSLGIDRGIKEPRLSPRDTAGRTLAATDNLPIYIRGLISARSFDRGHRPGRRSARVSAGRAAYCGGATRSTLRSSATRIDCRST
jgi:dTDP-4-dehydrorhamnose 3,5-epimerase